MARGVFMSHANIELNKKIKAKPTRVAIEELQLHDLQNIDAIVKGYSLAFTLLLFQNYKAADLLLKCNRKQGRQPSTSRSKTGHRPAVSIAVHPSLEEAVRTKCSAAQRTQLRTS